jgi:hypothetical protein
MGQFEAVRWENWLDWEPARRDAQASVYGLNQENMGNLYHEAVASAVLQGRAKPG